MPRSGTTLTEQILSSDKNVYGAGELPLLSKIVKDEFIKDNKVDGIIADHWKSLELIKNKNRFKSMSDSPNLTFQECQCSFSSSMVALLYQQTR